MLSDSLTKDLFHILVGIKNVDIIVTFYWKSYIALHKNLVLKLRMFKHSPFAYFLSLSEL